MLEKFIDHQKSGDKRILLLNGRFLGSFTRIPQKSDFRANMSLGASIEPAKLTSREKKIILSLRPYLKKNGLWLTGIDILNGHLSEINVTSPAGVPEINAFEGSSLEKQIVKFIEQRV